MIDLSTTTLWACVWSANKALLYFSQRVLRHCRRIINFQDTILFGSIEPDFNIEGIRFIKIPELSADSWNAFHVKTVPEYIQSDFAMSVHEDGFPIAPNYWNPEFLKYDYIGAPWKPGIIPGCNETITGNGGFAIESRRFLMAKQQLQFADLRAYIPSDICVCYYHKKEMESQGVVYAPPELALKYSTESMGNNNPSFGFHGRKNPKYIKGWAEIDRMDINYAVASQRIKVDVVYILVAGIPAYVDYAKRFVASYVSSPPQYPHNTIIVCNLGAPSQAVKEMFSPLQNVKYVLHDNSGYDIGGFQTAARDSDADLILCLGASTYFNGPGWLSRVVESFVKHGDALYGTMGNRGDAGAKVNRHIRSTAFWLPPRLLNQYPKVVSKPQRYEFEHGGNCLTEWMMGQGYEALVVSRKDEYEWDNWDRVPNGFHRGDQSNLMIGDHISERPHYPR